MYPGLLDIIFGIVGLVNKRSSHASGVILFDEDPYEFGCFMRTPKGEVITQYDLHDCEAAGMVKYDFLVTEVQDKLAQTIRFLQEDGEIEDNGINLRSVYDKYFHPNILPKDDEKVWNAIRDGSVINVFQFDSEVGSQAAKKIKPQTISELADANGLMRLMTAEKGAETPMEKYIRFKNDISLWYHEMDNWGLTKEEQASLEPYFKSSYGVPPSQEQLMLMLMDPNICNFNLMEANTARKIVGKKQMSKIPELHQKILDSASSDRLGKYIWQNGVGPQMGYSFSVIHALAYSFIGFQTAYIATRWSPIYWDAACLVVNSGSLEEEDENEYDEDDQLIFEGELRDGIRYRGKEYKDNEIIFEGEYKDDKRWNGKGIEYDSGDRIIFEGDYREGKKWKGKGNDYNSYGKLIFKREYDNGMIIKEIEYNIKGIKIFEGELKNSEKYKGKKYNNLGELIFEGEFKNNQRFEGKAKNNLYEFTYINGKIESKNIAIYDYINHELFIGEYKEGEKYNGILRTYFDEINYILKREVEVKEGNINGKGKEYYGNQKLKYEGNYKNGKKNGEGILYYRFSGYINYVGNFKDGKKEGQGKEFDNWGNLIYEGLFSNDEIVN